MKSSDVAIILAFLLLSKLKKLTTTIAFAPSSTVVHTVFRRSQTGPLPVQTAQHLHRFSDFHGILNKNDEHSGTSEVPVDKYVSLGRKQNDSFRSDARGWVQLIKKATSLHTEAQKASLPNKNHVSFHSRFSKAAVSLAIISLFPLWSPKFEGLFPNQLFSIGMDVPTNQLMLMNVAGAGLVMTMILGKLRFRRSTLRSRKRVFDTISEGMWGIYFLPGFTNLSVHSGSVYVLDAWSWPFKALITATVLKHTLTVASLYHDVITGPKRGRYANPWYCNCAQGLFSTTVYFLSTFLAVVALLPIFDSRDMFDAVTVPIMALAGVTQCSLVSVRLLTVLYLSMGAFWGTLMFEKKISPRTGNVLLGLTFLLTLFDNYRFLFGFLSSANREHAAISYILSYTKGMLAKTHLAAVWFLPSLLAIAHGTLSVAKREWNEQSLGLGRNVRDYKEPGAKYDLGDRRRSAA